MSKIITKKDLELVIENTLKENGIISEMEEEVTEEVSEEVTEEVVEECGEDDIDNVEESVNELAESVKETTNTKILKEEMDNFKRLINHRI